MKRMQTPNDIRAALKRGESTIGSWMQLPDSSVAEILGRAGYDWVAVDLEHGAFSRENLADMFRALALGGTLPMARIAQSRSKDIKSALDTGAMGLIFPMIESADQLTEAIHCSRYPPKGRRGVGFSRANMFGQNFDDYLTSSEEIVKVAQIEHIQAVENIDGIMLVDGLDAIMIGPYDLSGSMGISGRFDHPDYMNALEKIRKSAESHNIPTGLHIVMPDRDVLKDKIINGWQFIAYGTDAVFLYTGSRCPILS